MSETTAEYNAKNVPSTDRTMLLPKQLARIGIFYLEEAILEVLFEAMETLPENPFVRAVDIARKIGVEHWTNENWLVSDILYKLKAEGRVEQRERRGPWKLTETEYQKRL